MLQQRSTYKLPIFAYYFNCICLFICLVIYSISFHFRQPMQRTRENVFFNTSFYEMFFPHNCQVYVSVAADSPIMCPKGINALVFRGSIATYAGAGITKNLIVQSKFPLQINLYSTLLLSTLRCYPRQFSRNVTDLEPHPIS